MKLRSVHVEGFRAIRSLAVPLDPALTVLHGNNAHGKTSLLAAIAVGLGAIPTILSGSGGIGFRKTDTRQGSELAYVRLEASDGLVWDRWDSAYGGMLRAQAGGFVGTKPLREYLAPLAEGIKSGQTTTLPVFVFYDTDRAVFELPERKRNFHDTFTRFDAYVNALAPKPSFKALVEWFYAMQFAEQFAEIGLNLGSYQSTELPAVRRAIESMLPGVSNPQIEPPVRFVVTRQGEDGRTEKLLLDQLSGGYRIVLAVAADLARRMVQANPHLPNPLESEAIVLIDEIELHLHPEWQQRVIGDFRRTFPNAQFILSTHSPQVLTTVAPQHIVHLRATADGIVAEQETGATFGARAGDVLQAVMHVDQRPHNDFSVKLRQYRDMIAADQGESEPANALRAELERLSPDDPEIGGADVEIRRRRVMRDIAKRA